MNMSENMKTVQMKTQVGNYRNMSRLFEWRCVPDDWKRAIIVPLQYKGKGINVVAIGG